MSMEVKSFRKGTFNPCLACENLASQPKRRMGSKSLIMLSFLAICMFLGVSMAAPQNASAVTKWWKIAPGACTPHTYTFDDAHNAYNYGEAATYSPGSATHVAYYTCPVFLPHGVTANKLRIRNFQSGGLPANTSIYAYMYRRTWNSSTYTIGNAYMNTTGATYDDANFSTVINNENYQYNIVISLYSLSGHSTSSVAGDPALGMIEIRYDE